MERSSTSEMRVPASPGTPTSFRVAPTTPVSNSTSTSARPADDHASMQARTMVADDRNLGMPNNDGRIHARMALSLLRALLPQLRIESPTRGFVTARFQRTKVSGLATTRMSLQPCQNLDRTT